MLKYSWNEEKNKLLKETRGVSFNDVIGAIESGFVLKVIKHTNPSKYPHQKIMIVSINKYTYCVPFIKRANQVFLKTIYASRKYKYLIKEEK